MPRDVIEAAVRLRECHNGAGPSCAYLGHQNWREAADADAALLARDYLDTEVGGDKDQQASAWLAVCRELKAAGMDSFFADSGPDTGRARVIQFIQYLVGKSRCDELDEALGGQFEP